MDINLVEKHDSLASKMALLKPSGFEEQAIELSYPEANSNDRNKYIFEDVEDNPLQTVNVSANLW
jgi:hypothetical protein